MKKEKIHFASVCNALRYIFLCAMVLIIGCGLCACKDRSAETQVQGTVQQTPSVTIETVYGPIQFPEALAGSMRHMEITEGDIAMEVFYMLMENGERELFRVIYGDPNMGDLLGLITTDAGEIPVTYSICEYTQDDFQDEESWNLYYSMMDGFSVVLQSISEDARFSESKPVAEIETVSAKLTYWTVPVPANVRYEEKAENSLYSVAFYGTIDDEEVKLYTIYLGEPHAESVLGTYKVSGEEKIVSVDVSGISDADNLSQEDYKMINSINDVIQVIVTDKNFAAE